MLALIGGAVAVGSAWLPWMTVGGSGWSGIDATTSDMGLANGNYLVGVGILAAICGLLVALGAARASGRMLLGLGVLLGAIGILGVEVAAYLKMSDFVSEFNSFGTLADINASVGWGIFVGAGGGLMAGVGGLLTLAARPSPAPAPVTL
jgi:hypothetical protein